MLPQKDATILEKLQHPWSIQQKKWNSMASICLGCIESISRSWILSYQNCLLHLYNSQRTENEINAGILWALDGQKWAFRFRAVYFVSGGTEYPFFLICSFFLNTHSFPFPFLFIFAFFLGRVRSYMPTCIQKQMDHWDMMTWNNLINLVQAIQISLIC